MPERSARAAALASSSSVACSTTPVELLSVRIAFCDRHRVADLDRRRQRRLRLHRLEVPAALVGEVERVRRRRLGHDDAGPLGDDAERLHHVEAGAERADVAEVAARDDDRRPGPPSPTAARSRSRPSSVPRCAASSSSWPGRCPLPRPAAGRAPCSRRSRCRRDSTSAPLASGCSSCAVETLPRGRITIAGMPAAAA